MQEDILKELGLDGELPPARGEPTQTPIPQTQDQPKKKHCPFCLSDINPRAVVCAACCRDQPGFSSQPPQKKYHPGTAAVLSFFIPGLGQIYKGTILYGLLWFVVVPIGYLALILPGIILHIYCVIDAYEKA